MILLGSDGKVAPTQASGAGDHNGEVRRFRAKDVPQRHDGEPDHVVQRHWIRPEAGEVAHVAATPTQAGRIPPERTQLPALPFAQRCACVLSRGRLGIEVPAVLAVPLHVVRRIWHREDLDGFGVVEHVHGDAAERVPETRPREPVMRVGHSRNVSLLLALSGRYEGFRAQSGSRPRRSSAGTSRTGNGRETSRTSSPAADATCT